MQVNACCRLLLVGFLLVTPSFLATYARRGGGGSRGSSSRSSYSRPSPSYSRPSPSYSRPSPSYSRPAPAPAPRPAPAPAPRPAPAPSYSQPAPKPAPPVVVRQPAYNPSFKESNSGFGAGNSQPAYNPNYKPDSSRPAGPPPPYSPAGHPVPNAPVGPSPSYHSSNQPRQPSAYPQLPPPYSGLPGRPPAYPGLSSSYPAQPANQPYPRQPDLNRPYVVQPGYPGTHQSNVHRPYPVQPGFPGALQSNSHRPYPVQPGIPNPYPGVSRPYPQQSLGGNVWQPHYGMPAPSYMNYGGIPTGTNMYTKPHKKQGFLGSLMSLGKNKSEKKNKYYGSYPSPYGIGSTGISHGGNSFLGKHGSSAAMYSIFPYMAAKKAHKIRKPKFGFMSIYIPRRHYHHYGSEGDINSEYASHFDVYDDNYVGKCQKPIKKENSKVNCNATFDELQCTARCDEGYRLPNATKSLTNKCWHVTGVWKPTKNFPSCIPVCEKECLNGGECVGPEICKCPAEYRGSRCQFYFLKCNILKLIKDEKLGWSCMHYKNETVCHVRCKGSMDFNVSPTVEYRCTPDGEWKPETLPQCDADKN